MASTKGGLVGCVVIGRNEGERLLRCLRALGEIGGPVVYVDSHSKDGSLAAARALGVHAVELADGLPTNAASGRNFGLRWLRDHYPEIEYVQFLDGDCELEPGWIATGRAALDAHPDWAIVTGRRRERYPDKNVYNILMDVEWETNQPLGEVACFPGDFFGRARALEAVGGFDANLAAGEEPELCLRLRRAGWKAVKVDAPMSVHECSITRFSAWWRRAMRTGYAYAHGAWLHGQGPERYDVWEERRAIILGAITPLVALAFLVPSAGTSLLLLAMFLVSGYRGYLHARRWNRSRRDSAIFGTSVICRFPEVQGVLEFHLRRARGGLLSKIIEYK